MIISNDTSNVLKREVEPLLKKRNVGGVEILLLEFSHSLAVICDLPHHVVDLVNALNHTRSNGSAWLAQLRLPSKKGQ